jgi:Flp pilus assembly pilin Flp
MARPWTDQRGAASVEHAALVLLAALVACAVVALFTVGRGEDSSLASAIAFKQRCAVRYPAPCWQDPLTEAYGRRVAGAVRALAPAPAPRTGPTGEALVGVDYRRCRQPSCATWAGPHLTPSNRRTTAFTAVREASGGYAIDYWIYRPTIGWELVTEHIATADLNSHSSVPLLETADPVLVPLETLLGRDDARFSAGEEPPWRGKVESAWGR